MWPSTNIVDDVTPTGVEETLSLADAAAPAQFTFTVSGATGQRMNDGSVRLVANGRMVGSIPAPTVTLPATASRTVSAQGAQPTLRVVGRQLIVSVSKQWLTSLPATAFPVAIDPTYQEPTATTATSANTLTFNATGGVTAGVMQAGITSSGTAQDGAVYMPAPSAASLPAVASGDTPWQMTYVLLEVIATPTGSGTFSNQIYYDGATKPTYATVSKGYVSDLLPPYWQAPGYPSTDAGGWFGMTVPGAQKGQYITAKYNNISAIFTYTDPPPATTITAPTSGAVISTTTPTLTAPLSEPHMCTDPAYNEGNPVTKNCDYPDQLYYDFQISTSAVAGIGQIVADSGWQPVPYTTDSNDVETATTPLSWRVPAGSLVDGVKYYATIQENYYEPGELGSTVPAPAAPSAFQVKQRFGAGGPSPTDTVGAAPGQTSVPSAGSPNPGTSPASATVNLTTGNLALSVGTPAMHTVSGSLQIGLTYNSVQSSTSQTSISAGANYGLLGQYYVTSSVTSSHPYPSTFPNAQRVDPTINLDGSAASPPVGGLTPLKPFIARWSGQLRLPPSSAVPAGTTFELGGLTTGGMQIFLNGSSTATYGNNWTGTTSNATTGSTFETTTKLAAGSSYSIMVQDWDPAVSGETVQVLARELIPATSSTPATTTDFVIPSTWFAPAATGLPPGWTLNGNLSAAWTSITDLGTQVVVHSPSGATATFTNMGDAARTTDGYPTFRAPAGDSDSLADVGGTFQLSTANGYLYTFNGDGSLKSLTTVADDTHPGSLTYAYAPASTATGAPIVLETITDPVSTRAVHLYYGGQVDGNGTSECPTPPAGAVAAPTGYLCQIVYFDGSSTGFFYNANGQLGEVSNPGSSNSTFAYDSTNRIAAIQDAPANDYIAAGQPGSSSCSGAAANACPFDTTISYDAQGRVATVTQPSPTYNASRPQRSYAYSSTTGAGTTTVTIAGFSPAANGSKPAGVAYSESYDAQARIVSNTSSGGQTSYTTFDGDDRPIITVDGTGEQTSTVYDQSSNVTATYGPAPTACFSSSSVPAGVTLHGPMNGYLPVAAPTTTSGCNTFVPRTSNGYDEGITGLALTYWNNATFAGAATLHDTGIAGSYPGCTAPTSGNTSGYATDVCGSWAAGTGPLTSSQDPSGSWSLRQTGFLTFSGTAGNSSNDYEFELNGSAPTELLLDNQVVVNNDPSGAASPTANATGIVTLAPGVHSFELDISSTTKSSTATSYGVLYTADPNFSGVGTNPAWSGVSRTNLDPGYGLKTSSTDPDGDVTSTAYTAGNGIGAQYGLPTATTVGAGSSTALTTTTSYETPGAGTYLRETARTLPAGNQTTYGYWDAVGNQNTSAVCGVPANTNQGAQRFTETDPAPSSSTVGVEKAFVYDTEGRAVAEWTGPAGSNDMYNAGSYACTIYDTRGRISTQTWPATSTAPARTVTYSYAINGNPLVSSITDAGGTVTSTVDLLGRITTYQDSAGDVTTTTYNQAGQTIEVKGPGGDVVNTYDANTGNLSTVTYNGTLAASTSFNATTGRLTSVTYANYTAGAFGYSANGLANSSVFSQLNGGAMVAGDQLVFDPAGRQIQELTDVNGALTNPGGSGANDFTYDAAGRLTSATLPGETAAYGYQTNPTSDGCASTSGGVNTNRTSISTTTASGTSVVHSCYNTADQLVATVANPGGASASTNNAFAYDALGEQTNDAGASLSYDASGRLVSSTSTGGVVTTYAYDPLDRVVGRTVNGTTTRYGYDGFSDSPMLISASTALLSLPGGVSVAVQGGTANWAYPDLHGNITATTDAVGRTTSTALYDPWGATLAGTGLSNGNANLGAFGSAAKFTDTATGLIMLGARAYDPTEGRFTETDPIQGGCANAYTYVFGDPYGKQDLTGQIGCGRAILGGVLGLGSVVAGVAAVIPTPFSPELGLLSLGLGLGSRAAAGCSDPTCGVDNGGLLYGGLGTGLAYLGRAARSGGGIFGGILSGFGGLVSGAFGLFSSVKSIIHSC